jgi:hypothetical protein
MKIVSRLGWLILFALGLTICSAAFLIFGSANITLLAAAWPFGKVQAASLKTIRLFNSKAGAR